MLQAHLQLEKINARYAIMPGDPKRVDVIKQFLDNPKELAYNREFRSVEGTYKGLPIIAVSTGVGGSSASLAVEELHNLGVHTMLRVGSAGAYQKNIALGDLIIAEGAIRDDGVSRAYVDVMYPACPDHELLSKIIEVCKEKKYPHHVGVILSHETFYHDDNAKQETKWHTLGVLGADFESAGLFVVGRIRGCRCASILNNVVLYGQDSADSVADYVGGENKTALGEKHEIEAALEAFYRLENDL